MSSQSMSNRCSCITVKSKRCKNYSMKGTNMCYVHKSKQNGKDKQKDEQYEKQRIIHTTQSVIIKHIEFNDEDCDENKCQYRNKYGEYICKETKEDTEQNNKFCAHHNVKRMKYITTMRNFIDLAQHYRNHHFTLVSYMKYIDHMFRFVVKYKEYFVNYTIDSLIDAIRTMCNKNATALIFNYPTQLSLYKKEHSSVYIAKFDEIEKTVNKLRSHLQIRENRISLISNNIKINKLTEIHSVVKDEVIPVFSKGIDQKILSFIV